ncbi:LETM1 and EF-hand domain-containing protein 1, mitochondrial [Thelohanellus kitauei]|uniref:LETM1 and EF-hand domain-containing protein 1, mitochondrial n=1 Tax=Thelohanellus kitauei TaxID=669202 RepID=A0A0C2M8Q0_THEKT|nr:LETM1 and EF-hand domain-containing protein 1, mitochondrial [Thelohanellus kitauei]
MGIPLVETRPHLVHNILIKLHRIKAEDNYVFHERLIETLSNEQLQRMCVDRGISCLGNTRSRMVKRLNRWFEFSVKMHVELVFLYLTRVSHYDLNDLLSEVVNNPTCDIVNGIKMVFETDPSMDLDATYQYSVGIMKLLLSNYSTGFKV